MSGHWARGRRWPWAEVEALVRFQSGRAANVAGFPAQRGHRADLTVKEIAEVLGVHAKQVYRWRESGLDWVQADRVAVRLGLHPVLVWPEWLSDEEVAA